MMTNTKNNGTKKRVIFLNNLIWKPELPNFGYKYEALSKYYEGVMFHFSGGYQKKKSGDFVFLSLPFHGPVRYFRYTLFCVKSVLKNRRTDYIISYDPCIFCSIGYLLKLLTGAKLIAEVNVDHFEGADFTGTTGFRLKIKKMILLLLTKFAIKRADGVKFVSERMCKNYNEKFNFGRSITFFSYISTHVFDIERCSDKGYILFVGHPYKLKGVDVLIRAFQRISSDFPDVKLMIVGQCEERDEFDTLAMGNDNIQFQQGTEYDKIVPVFEGCKFFVLPSRTEGIPRVLVEAMACGKPVIGSRVGGIPEVIEDGQTGLLFESENDEDLAEKMHRLLTDTQLAEELGNNAAREIEHRFAPQRYVELYHEFLVSLN